MNPRSAAIYAAASLVFACFACGASTASGPGSSDGGGSGSGSGSGGSGSGSSSGGPGAGPCPATAPVANSTCAVSLAGVGCEYGDDVDLSCNTVMTCSQGVWTPATLGTEQTCPTPAATGACPATYAAAQTAGACTQSGLACGYADGRCDCAQPTGGPPAVGKSNTRWLCDDPGTGCPTPRPHLGSSCATSGQACDYGACSIPDGITLTCTNGSWQTSPTACAL